MFFIHIKRWLCKINGVVRDLEKKFDLFQIFTRMMIYPVPKWTIMDIINFGFIIEIGDGILNLNTSNLTLEIILFGDYYNVIAQEPHIHDNPTVFTEVTALCASVKAYYEHQDIYIIQLIKEFFFRRYM